MEININIENRLLKLYETKEFESKIQKGMVQAALIIQNAAKENSPIDTGTLRRSITSDLSQVTQGMVVVGSPLVYAAVREFVNYKNPQTKFYFRRAYDENQDRIREIFNDVLQESLG